MDTVETIVGDPKLNTVKVVEDTENKIISKRVLIDNVFDPDRILKAPFTRKDYENFVNRDVAFIQDEKWGFSDMVPKAIVRIEADPDIGSGVACWIDSTRIDGTEMTEANVTPDIIKDLARFLHGSRAMAEFTIEKQGYCVIPDLLKGSKEPEDRFMNFMVDTDGKLKFIDHFPLIGFERTLLKGRQKRYVEALSAAARRINDSHVIAEATALGKLILTGKIDTANRALIEAPATATA